MSKWLRDYYGKDFDKFNPSVVMEGEKYAVVRVQSSTAASAGFSRSGYVLIVKRGKHNVSHHRSLHEGTMQPEDKARMEAALKEAESGS